VAARYRYIFCDLLTDAYLAELPLKGVSYDHRINQAGVFSASMAIANAELSERLDVVMPRDTTDLSAGPGRIVLHVLRNDDLWGTYWIWYGKVSKSRRKAPTVEFRGMSLDGYMQQVEIQGDLSYTGVDQVEIARRLIADMQSDPHADLGMILASGNSGVARDRVYKAAEKGTYGQRLQELAEVNNGFEYRVDTRISSGVRVREWVWGYPRLGEIDTTHDFAEPGNILDWSEDVDASRGGTRWRARGDSVSTELTAESVPLTSVTVEATDLLAAGWPRIDRTVDYPGVTVQNTLDNYATFWAATAPGAVRIHTATVRLDDDPTLTPHQLGDYAAIRLVNLRYPRIGGVASFVRSWRVIGMEIRPPQRGNSVEEANLVFEEVVT
jgi:hypothetical protein